ncbi:hypothetical protein OJAV_G00035950 [Oryzias javanicus]|uniref:Uncharacterized protein n=1 Tax=Oryzias javanicus TaxID=123683 RepID=A0A3S2PEX1_ORYJA|nr:hypothetical protein OJAV_G00035950 [Oryzias javanicus]
MRSAGCPVSRTGRTDGRTQEPARSPAPETFVLNDATHQLTELESAGNLSGNAHVKVSLVCGVVEPLALREVSLFRRVQVDCLPGKRDQCCGDETGRRKFERKPRRTARSY